MLARMVRCVAVWAVVAAAGAFAEGEEALFGVPLKPDPPFAIDGDLSDWAEVPNAASIAEAEQVVWGKPAWESPEDFSGTVRIAWRYDCLFVAVDVIDDAMAQTQRGSGMWKGDHVELYLDMAPEFEPDREPFGANQYQLAFSPGNFLSTGDPLVDCAPEAYRYRPERGALVGAVVGAQRTATGWALEAAVPWNQLGIDRPEPGMPLRFEIGISDTDGIEPQQESLLTISTDTWGHHRSRLMPAALAGSDGVAKARSREVVLTDALELERGGTSTIPFRIEEIPADRDAVLVFRARLETPKVAGHTPSLRLTLNGAVVDGERMMNKPLRAKGRDGRVYTLAAGDRYSIYYSPDFDSPDRHPQYALVDGSKACTFELRVTDLLHEGDNELVLEHAAADSVDNRMHVADLRVALRTPPPPPKPKAGPPTGPIPTITPDKGPAGTFTFKELPDAKIAIDMGGETYVIESRFSTPAPGWVHGSSEYFDHSRETWKLPTDVAPFAPFPIERPIYEGLVYIDASTRFEARPEAVIVRDTFTNKTDEPLALMHRHSIAREGQPDAAWLAGLEQGGGAGSTAVPANPTTYVCFGDAGMGFLAMDDVFRLHVTNYIVPGESGIADNHLVLAPGATYTADWAIVPTDEADYWRFINAARRLMFANFPIEGGFAFLRADPLTEKWTDEQIADFIRFKDPRWVCASITYPRYKGRYTHGTAFQQVTHDNYRNGFERWRRLAPDRSCLVYFHCFLDVVDESPELFADARTLRPDGTHATYGKEYDRIYFPTEDNSYGRAVVKNVDIILDEIGADGVYWDEHEYSRVGYHYGEPWDGYSGDVDPRTMTVTRLKSSVTLLSETWRVALAQRIMRQGPLVGNGPPLTRAMAHLRFPCFVETGSITNCTRAHLYSPIALGDHLTERSEQDAYEVMLAALDYGCVYHWYGDVTVMPTHHHLTRYMYPITPLELHEGYIIGRQRIVTNRSGLYGWGDNSQFEVHVFDDTGCEVEGFEAPVVEQDGNRFVELRIGEDWSAAIVRRQN